MQKQSVERHSLSSVVKTQMAVANAAKVIGRCSSNQNAAKEERDSFSGSREGGCGQQNTFFCQESEVEFSSLSCHRNKGGFGQAEQGSGDWRERES